MTTQTVAQFLAGSGLPPLDQPHDQVAEKLVALAHRGVNWDVWGPRRRVYWDRLAQRVHAGTYAGPGLADWWQDLRHRLDTEPRTAADRALAGALLADPAPRQVLASLRKNPEYLVLRVRVAVENNRSTAQPEETA